MMRVIIPAKSTSTRVPNKNWRDFYRGKSLVDINILAILNAGIAPDHIHVSSDSLDHLETVQARYGVIGLPRDESLCHNDTSIGDFIRCISSQVTGHDDIAWSQVCDPLFNEHAEVFKHWETVKALGYDSLSVVHPVRQYMMTNDMRPIGWGFGQGHVQSQKLTTLYQFPFTLSVLTRDCIKICGYHIGANPRWFVSSSRSIDIDTESDFEVARILYERQHA